MGLDIYFYKQNKNATKDNLQSITISYEEISELFSDNDIRELLLKLKQYSIVKNESVKDLLIKSINRLVDNDFSAIRYTECGEEVGYFRKFYWLIDHFNYTDDFYGQNMPLSKSQMEEVVELCRKTILMVEKKFSDAGYKVSQSATYIGRQGRLTDFSNAVWNEEFYNIADEICQSVFEEGRISFNLFEKVCTLYYTFSKILNEIDFDNEVICMSADW